MDLETGADFEHSQSLVRRSTETDALLDEDQTVKKPFYRPRPLWLVPFALTAALTRGMTVAPRVEIFTQLACSRVHGNAPYNHTGALSPLFTTSSSNSLSTLSSFYSTLDPLGPPLDPQYLPQTIYYNSANSNDDTQEDDPRRLPTPQCLGDPAVQAGAAQLQTIMATTAGLLSALTTGYWGRFSERHGRTKVLAITTFGLFLTDLTFILVSTPTSPLSSHGHKLLLLAPVIEGALGGWSALSSAASAYLSDCTSNGSRALIFSRFSGVYSFGLAIGPSLGGYLIRNPVWNAGQVDGAPTVTSVFWVAIFASFFNFILVLFVFPESIGKARRAENAAVQSAETLAKGKAVARAADDASSSAEETAPRNTTSIADQLLRPLAVFLPVTIYENGRRYKDRSLMFLGLSFFIYMLAQGVYQVKYLYATHVYEWGAEQLSYYISFMGGIKTIFLLFFIPWVIAAFKPKPKLNNTQESTNGESNTKATKPKPTRSYLVQEIKFDLRLAKYSFLVEILSQILVVLSPLPVYHAHGSKIHPISWHSKEASQACFVAATTVATLSGGSLPAIHSLALSILQLRNLADGASSQSSGKEKTGELFGALAVLGAIGSGITAPILFGLIYSGTVAAFPRSIFVAAAAFIFISLALLMCVRAPGAQLLGKNGKGKKRAYAESERGRSRISKDLRGGASMNYGSMAGPSNSSISS